MDKMASTMRISVVVECHGNDAFLIAADDVAFSLEMILDGLRTPPDGNEDPEIWHALLENAEHRLTIFKRERGV
jgi:hypothetical protein